MTSTYIFNHSARPILTFKTQNDAEKKFDHFDYSLLRFPELYAVAISACSNPDELATAFTSLPKALKQDLLFYNILQPSQDGGVKLTHNTRLLLTLALRFSDQPSRREMIAIAGNEEALAYVLANLTGKPISTEALSADSMSMLVDKGGLVSSPAPAKSHFPVEPNPSLNLDSNELLDFLYVADPVFIQHRSESLPPAPVLDILGKHMPELPDEDTIAWGCHAGSRMPLFKIVSEQEAKTLNSKTEQYSKPHQQLKNTWRKKLSTARSVYKTKDYIHLTDIIPEFSQPQLRQHIRNLVRHNYFGKLGDGQVEKRISIHNEPVCGIQHHRLSKIVSAIVGEKVVPSYCYLSLYLGGADLPKHIDRDQCQFNCSIVIDMYDKQGNDVDPWPIYLRLGKKTAPVNMNIGDGVIYRGNKLEHWRDPLPDDQFAAVCFYHFVAEDFKGTLI